MEVNKKYLSFYYEDIVSLPDIVIDTSKTALLVVDMQKHFISKNGDDAEHFRQSGQWERWFPYFDYLEKVVIPNNKKLIECCRKNNIEVTFGRIASLKANGKDRSRVQSTVGWNNILVPIDSEGADMVEELKPLLGEIVVNKTTDSVSLGTNYTQLIRNMGIDTVIVTGVVTDQCVAGTVRVLADQGFRVICVEDCCAAPDMNLHHMELKIMNIIYCNVLSTNEVISLITN
jgi:nicotinamidase-related amidase